MNKPDYSNVTSFINQCVSFISISGDMFAFDLSALYQWSFVSLEDALTFMYRNYDNGIGFKSSGGRYLLHVKTFKEMIADKSDSNNLNWILEKALDNYPALKNSLSLYAENIVIPQEAPSIENEATSIFNFDSKQLRVIQKDGEPWFVAKDVCDILEFRDTNDATKYIENEDISTCPDNSSGQVRHIRIVNEPGLYSLVLRSRKPEAKKFKRWITHEVLPTIRKTGTYSIEKKETSIVLPNFEDPAEAAIAWATEFKAKQQAQNEIKALESKITEDAPKVAAAETFLNVKAGIGGNEFTKMLANAGVDINIYKLYAFLRDEKVFMKGLHENDPRRNKPMQRYMDLGWFYVKETAFKVSDEDRVSSKTLFTPLGQKEVLEFVKKHYKAENYKWVDYKRKRELQF